MLTYNDENVVWRGNYFVLDNGREATLKEYIDMSSEAVQNQTSDIELDPSENCWAVCRKRKSILTAIICICILILAISAGIKNHGMLPF